MITIINKLSDFKACHASHKTLIAVGGEDDRYKLTADKFSTGIQFEIIDDETPTSKPNCTVFYGASYKNAMHKLRVLDDADCIQDCNPENIYGSASIAQSIAEDRK